MGLWNSIYSHFEDRKTCNPNEDDLSAHVPHRSTRWQCVHRQIFSQGSSALKPLPFSSSLFPFLTLFSRRWSSINTQQWGIYREDFVLSSEANNYQIWWKIEHILRLNVISLSLCLSRTWACTHTDTFGCFFTHRDTYTRVLPSEAGFIYVL